MAFVKRRVTLLVWLAVGASRGVLFGGAACKDFYDDYSKEFYMASRSAKGVALRPGLFLWQAATRWRRVVKRVLAPFGLTLRDFLVLEGVVQAAKALGRPEPSHTDVGVVTGIDKMTVSHAMAALERLGLVQRCSDDGRSWALDLTAEGHRVREMAHRAFQQAEEEFFGRAVLASPRQLGGVLQRLASGSG